MQDDDDSEPPADEAPTEDLTLPAPPPADSPVESSERYRIDTLIGTGAMGQVYKAFDRVLNRYVALKFLHVQDPALVERFQREARAQAGISHDRICKVYDVGEIAGKHFIAMQLIDGGPLDQAARQMSLEQKVLAVKEIAEGLNEAHTTGLIHRDIKPKNILVERAAEGGWRPYLVDFGLAWEPGSSGNTLPGTVVGTPSFMSPEQARGETIRVDRRSDVYGLGATLYAILAGRPPFEGTVNEVLRRVADELPVALRRVDATTPRDVESVTMQCLRKDPNGRYPSARSLADDLQRYLSGEPVDARPTGIWYRLKLKAAKNRPAVATAGVALLLVAIIASWAGWVRNTSARQTRLAERFTQRAQQIDFRARSIHLVPLHDIRGERATLRGAVQDIEREMREAGHLALGPGHFALGRGFMALEDFTSARRHLETAWKAGFEQPEVAAALGRVMGELYRTALRDAENAPDEPAREERRKAVERDYRDPALRYLQRGRGAESQSPEFGEALLAFYGRHHDDALGKARTAYERRPWFYEARQLEGDIHLAKAEDQADRGAYDAARKDYDRAEQAYEGAIAVARSDPAVYASRCKLRRSMMRTEINGRGADVAPYFKEGLEACDLALQADPDHTEALLLEADMHNRMGEYLRKADKDPLDNLSQAVALASRALAIRPDDDRTYQHIGRSYRERAIYEGAHAQDPKASLARSVEAYGKAIAIEPSAENYNDIGIVYKTQALYERDHGADPRPSLELAIEMYRKSIAVEPEQVEAHSNEGVAHYHFALYEQEHGEDPRGRVENSIVAFQEAIAINPNQMTVHYNLGRSFAEQATYEQDKGQDPRASLEKAIEAYRKAIAINPTSANVSHFQIGVGGAFDSLGTWEREHGGDPGKSFALAIDAYQKAIASNPRNVNAYNSLGYVSWSLAEHQLDRGENPDKATRMAIDAARKAIEINAGFEFAYVNLGDAYRVQARAELGRGAEATASLRAAKLALRDALDINEESRYAHFAHGRLLALEARGRIEARRNPLEAITAAEQSLREAIRLDPDDASSHLALADLYRWRATWESSQGRSPAASVEPGLAAADRALALNPSSAEALAVRGGLLLLKAEDDSTPAGQRRTMDDARGFLERALAANSNLSREYRPILDGANRRLSAVAVAR